jgi:hypothetical protein
MISVVTRVALARVPSLLRYRWKPQVFSSTVVVQRTLTPSDVRSAVKLCSTMAVGERRISPA